VTRAKESLELVKPAVELEAAYQALVEELLAWKMGTGTDFRRNLEPVPIFHVVGRISTGRALHKRAIRGLMEVAPEETGKARLRRCT